MKKQTSETIAKSRNIKSGIQKSPSSFVTRIAEILECLGDGINSVTDISRQCNLSISTTHRLLNTLKGPLLTVYEPGSHRYYLGPLVAKFTAKPKATHQYLIMCSLNEMGRLSDITEETISLDMVIGIQFIHLFEIYSKHRIKVLGETREIQPVIPVGAAQKVLLSQLEDKDLRFALKTAENWATDEHYITDIEVIKCQLSQIKQQGYAISRGEAILGAVGISVPIRNYCCPATLTVLGPESRLVERIPDLIKELKVSTEAISKDILEFL